METVILFAIFIFIIFFIFARYEYLIKRWAKLQNDTVKSWEKDFKDLTTIIERYSGLCNQLSDENDKLHARLVEEK